MKWFRVVICMFFWFVSMLLTIPPLHITWFILQSVRPPVRSQQLNSVERQLVDISLSNLLLSLYPTSFSIYLSISLSLCLFIVWRSLSFARSHSLSLSYSLSFSSSFLSISKTPSISSSLSRCAFCWKLHLVSWQVDLVGR